MKIDIGISEKDRAKIIKGLQEFSANNFALYLKTHNYHWNVSGPMFQTLHLMFETQYNELWLASDAISERIKSLGGYAVGSFSDFQKLAAIKDDESKLSAIDMLKSLVSGHEIVVKCIREVFPCVEKAGDEATADLLTQRLQIHEKTLWMLRSLLAT